jgi:hypothetical protein
MVYQGGGPLVYVASCYLVKAKRQVCAEVLSLDKAPLTLHPTLPLVDGLEVHKASVQMSICTVLSNGGGCFVLPQINLLDQDGMLRI